MSRRLVNARRLSHMSLIAKSLFRHQNMRLRNLLKTPCASCFFFLESDASRRRAALMANTNKYMSVTLHHLRQLFLVLVHIVVMT